MAIRLGHKTPPRPPKTPLQRLIDQAERKQWEDLLAAQLHMADLFPERQYKALADRDYRWDFGFA